MLRGGDVAKLSRRSDKEDVDGGDDQKDSIISPR